MWSAVCVPEPVLFDLKGINGSVSKTQVGSKVTWLQYINVNFQALLNQDYLGKYPYLQLIHNRMFSVYGA